MLDNQHTASTSRIALAVLLVVDHTGRAHGTAATLFVRFFSVTFLNDVWRLCLVICKWEWQVAAVWHFSPAIAPSMQLTAMLFGRQSSCKRCQRVAAVCLQALAPLAAACQFDSCGISDTATQANAAVWRSAGAQQRAALSACSL